MENRVVQPDEKRSKEKFEEFTSDPLDALVVPVTSSNGIRRDVSAISIGFMEPRTYITYKSIPCLFRPYDGNCTDADIDEWLERMSLYEEDMTWLLRLTHQRFWCQVIFDDNLQLCLQSYLSRAPRNYDLNTSMREDILQHQKHVHKLVFLVFLRMSTYKESKLHHITPGIFGEIIYDRYIFDVPRMMDLSVLYGFDNQQIISKMIQSLITTQPSYLDDLEESIKTTVSAFDTIEQKLKLQGNFSVEERKPHKLEDPVVSDLSSMPLAELQDIVDFLTDASATLYCFFDACPQAGVTFYKCGAPLRVPPFYDRVFPTLENELKERLDLGESETRIESISRKLVFSKAFLVKAFRNLVTASCIHPVLNARCDRVDESENSESFHLENYLHLFTEVATEKVFLKDYNQLFPFSEDLELFSAAGIPVDTTSLNYILSSVQNPTTSNVPLSGDTAMPTTKNHVEVPSSEKISNMQELAASLCSVNTETKNGDIDFYENNASCPRPDDVQLISLIQAIHDIIPGYGDGFLEACLTHYDFDCEKVVDALITDSLAPDLAKMDRHAERKVPMAAEGTGPSSYLSERKSIFDGDEFDVFNREDVALDRMRKGKSGKTPSNYSGFGVDEGSAALKALTLRYELEIVNEEAAREERILYEDEYDDTYDSHPVGLIEVQPENELLRIRPFRVPAALQALQKGRRKNDADDEAEDGSDDEGNEQEVSGLNYMEGKDNFCIDPAILRQRAEERRLSKMRNHPRAQGGEGQSRQPDYHNKERNKGRGANHNRRNQSDFKRSRGMLSMR